MANFIIVVDPDPERRSHFIKTIQPYLPLVEGLIANSCSTKDFYAIWAASPHAPIDYITDEGGAAIVWGEAIAPESSERIDALSLRNVWKSSPNRVLPPFDGFHALAVYHPHLGLRVGADLLGLFPVYYYTHGDVALVGSSPELFRYHPLFKKVFNPAGLVGLLLINSLFDGQTLWQDVRRLASGSMLLWQPGTSAQEVRQYSIADATSGQDYANLPFAKQIDILEQTLEQAIARHAPAGKQYGLFLSGGLDSRMLAGFLQRRGINPVALTVGRRTDLEMECAVSVARALRLEHHATEIPMEQYPSYADLVVNWEHLANGCDSIMGLGWGVYSQLGNLSPRVISGCSLDRVIGGTSTYYLPTEALSFESFFGHAINRCGFSPKILERLLKREVFGDLVQETIARIQTVYESYSDVEFTRTWWFELFHRQRFLIGSLFGWQLCFGAWPVLLHLDWHVLKTVVALPVETLDKRRAQYNLVGTRFGKLNRLPLDRNTFNTKPLHLGSRTQRLAGRLHLYRLQEEWRQWQQRLGYDRRHYFRTFDLNNPGWRIVRQEAEPYRKQVEHLFHKEVLDELLPTPNVAVKYQADAINEPSSLKALLGLLLWSKGNF
jgi:asparagine synthase (glutamine-hydrolysing)